MIGLAVPAVIAALLGAIVGAGAGSSDAPTERASALPEECTGSSPAALRRMAATKLIVRWEGRHDPTLLRRARAGAIGGVILFPDTSAVAEDVAAEIAMLQEAATAGGAPPLVVAIDQEGGPVKRFVEQPPTRSPYDLGQSGTAADARLEGRATGNFLGELGANVDLAPVLDVPSSPDAVIAFRAFGSDVRTVAQLGLAFADGLEQEGVVATAKHFPGLGRSLVNTDLAPARIDASRLELQRDLTPFEAAVEDEIGMVMVGLAVYPAYGPGPAALSDRVIDGLLRRRLGYQGVVITDDLGAGAISTETPAAEAAIEAAGAGADLLLFAGEPDPRVLDALVRATERGRVDLGALQASCVRIVALREGLEP